MNIRSYETLPLSLIQIMMADFDYDYFLSIESSTEKEITETASVNSFKTEFVTKNRNKPPKRRSSSCSESIVQELSKNRPFIQMGTFDSAKYVQELLFIPEMPV